MPNWLPLSFRVADGPWFDVQQAGVLDHRLELDLRQGTLTRYLRWQDPDGRRTSVVQRRLVSLKDQHLAGLETTFGRELVGDNPGPLRAGRPGSQCRCQAVPRPERPPPGGAARRERTPRRSSCRSRPTSRTSWSRWPPARLLRDGRTVQADRRLVSEPGFVAHELTFELQEGRPATVEKVVALYTSRDRAISESLLDARQAAQAAAGFELLARHEGTWRILWNRFDIQLDSANEWTETILHLHIFHLLQTVSPEHLDVGVPARGWHGEAYRGHIFWDELFIFPFFNLQQPRVAAALLDYRHARLGAARRRPSRPATRGPCFRGRAAPTGARRPSSST